MGALSRTAYELRDLLRRQTGACCVCRFTYQGIRARIDSIFYEQVTDRDVRATIRAARGFCRGHSQMVSEHGDALGAALIMQDVLTNELRAMENGEYSLPRAGGPFSRLMEVRRLGPAVCPLCLAQDDIDAAGVDALLEGLHEADFAEAFRASTGLCLPHLRIARERARDDGAWKTVIETEQRELQILVDQLDELARKSDYRFAHEGVSPDEARSWRRALAVSSGIEESV